MIKLKVFIKYINKWYSASADWFVPHVKQDFKIGGEFSYTFSAKDHSFSFDYKGYFTEIVNNQIIAYKLAEKLGKWLRNLEVIPLFTQARPKGFLSKI